MPPTTTEEDLTIESAHRADHENQWAYVDFSFGQWGGVLHFDEGFKAFCYQKIDKLASLQPDWDGGGAPRIDPQIIQAARRFIAELPEHVAMRPMVVPLSSGSLQFEWHRGRRALELEFESPEEIHYLKWDPDNHVEEEQVISAVSRPAILAMIRWFMQGVVDG